MQTINKIGGQIQDRKRVGIIDGVVVDTRDMVCGDRPVIKWRERGGGGC